MRIYILSLISILLIACRSENRVYEKHLELSPNIEWLKKDIRTFEIPVNDTAPTYHFFLAFGFTNGYQFDHLKVKITEKSPSGKETQKEYTVKIKDENGNYIGDPGYDIWDSEHLIEANKKFHETGTYTYKIEHMMPKDPLHFAMEIGLILDKTQ